MENNAFLKYQISLARATFVLTFSHVNIFLVCEDLCFKRLIDILVKTDYELLFKEFGFCIIKLAT